MKQIADNSEIRDRLARITAIVEDREERQGPPTYKCGICCDRGYLLRDGKPKWGYVPTVTDPCVCPLGLDIVQGFDTGKGTWDRGLRKKMGLDPDPQGHGKRAVRTPTRRAPR